MKLREVVSIILGICLIIALATNVGSYFIGKKAGGNENNYYTNTIVINNFNANVNANANENINILSSSEITNVSININYELTNLIYKLSNTLTNIGE